MGRGCVVQKYIFDDKGNQFFDAMKVCKLNGSELPPIPNIRARWSFLLRPLYLFNNRLGGTPCLSGSEGEEECNFFRFETNRDSKAHCWALSYLICNIM
jgi:hypothetical protein